MPKPNNQPSEEAAGQSEKRAGTSSSNKEIKIKVSRSSIAEFTQRQVPTAGEVKKFEDMIDEAAYPASSLNRRQAEARDDEIDESLNEIYQDDDGSVVNVKQLDIKKKHGIIFWLTSFFVALGCLGIAGYAAYRYLYLQPGSDATAVEFSIDGETEVTAGEEFFYTLHYRNASNVPIRNARLAVTYPENFIFLDSQPEANEQSGVWLIDSIPAKYSGQIKIKGSIIAPTDATGFISAALTYSPANFSSEFKKEATMTTTVRNVGIDFDFDYIKSVLVGEENELLVKFRGQDKNFINDFRVSLEPADNIELVVKKDETKIDNEAEFTQIRPGVWEVLAVLPEERVLPIYYKIKDKKTDTEDIKLTFDYAYSHDNGATTTLSDYYTFQTETLNLEVMKSDLNLTMIINGSENDQGVDFGDTLHYTIAYKNKGETEMKDVVIMAVFDSDFLNWASLDDPAKGKKKDNTISWSKAEIPALESIAKNADGTIDFSIKVANLGKIDPQKAYQVKSYAQYSVGNKEDFSANMDNHSNTIINKINSDLKLDEQARYFSVDNIPVGTGPQPPKVGETTSYKIYWNLTNTLHELTDVTVTVDLPAYIEWDGKNQASVGNLYFDEANHRVVWDIGRLPITAVNASAEFSIKMTPTETDRNKIIVLLPGSTVKAIDSETKAELTATTKAETSRLDDDNIAQGDGIVE